MSVPVSCWQDVSGCLAIGASQRVATIACMEPKRLPWFGTYTPGVNDGTAIDAIAHGDLNVLEAEFAERNIDEPLQLDAVEATPLGAAIASGRIDSVRWLLGRGAHLDTTYSNAFLDAAYHGGPALLRELAAAGADIHANRGSGDAFERALYGERAGNLAVIDNLGHDAKTFGGPALRTAVFDRNREAVEFLVAHGADVNFTGPGSVFPNNETPLHIAVRTGDLELVQLLTEAGADTQLVDDVGNRPYEDAVQAGRLAIADHLRQFEPAARRTREWVLASAAAKDLPSELITFLESGDRRLTASEASAPVAWIDFLPLTDTVPVRVGRTRTVLRLSRETDNYSNIWIVWSPRLKRVGAVVSDIALQFYRLGTWEQYLADPFAGIARILSGEARPTSA